MGEKWWVGDEVYIKNSKQHSSHCLWRMIIEDAHMAIGSDMNACAIPYGTLVQILNACATACGTSSYRGFFLFETCSLWYFYENMVILEIVLKKHGYFQKQFQVLCYIFKTYEINLFKLHLMSFRDPSFCI